MEQPLTVTEPDVKDPTLLLRHLRKSASRLGSLADRIGKLERETPLSIDSIQSNLQSGGSNPINVQNLLGVLSLPQKAGVPRLSSIPTDQILQQYQDTVLILTPNTGTSTSARYDLQTVVGGNPNTLIKLIAGLGSTAGGGNFMTLDTVQTVTTAGVKTVSVPWVFSGTTGGLFIRPSSAPTPNTKMWTVETSTGGILAWADAEGDMQANSLKVVGSAADTIVVAPASAPAADTILAAVKTSTGGYVFSVDSEGDMIANTAYLQGIGGLTVQPTSPGALAPVIHVKATTGAEQFSVTSSGKTYISRSLTVDGDITSTGGNLGLSTTAGQITCFGLTAASISGTSITASLTITINGLSIQAGSGSPEGSITAPVGSLFLRANGGAGTSLYVKESGVGNVGWVGK